MLGQLQDSGNVTTIRGYMELLEAAFLIKVLQKFSTRPISIKSSIPKLFPRCPALVHATGSAERIGNDPEWKGRVFESAIGSALLESYRDLYYWREGDAEVDFVVLYKGIPLAVEVKSGRKKKQKGLLEFKKKYPDARTLTIDLELGEKLLESNKMHLLIEELIS
jgi:predicted AAA+ superfamily ATPase